MTLGQRPGTVAPRAAVVLALLGGCAKAHNYLDPTGPLYQATRAEPAGERSPRTLRIVTLNVEYGRMVDAAIEALRRHPCLRDADLLMLQEMDAPGVEAVARALGLNYVYYPISLHPTTGRDFGNAVLTPWPIEESWKVPLPHRSLGRRQARAAVGVVVRLGSVRLRAYSVHLGAPIGTSGGKRGEQAEVVIADAAGGEGPAIVAGDFNSKKVGRRFAAAGFAWPTASVGTTVARPPLKLSFDHVFVRGLTPVGTGAGVAQEAIAIGDHRPVWVELALP